MDSFTKQWTPYFRNTQQLEDLRPGFLPHSFVEIPQGLGSGPPGGHGGDGGGGGGFGGGGGGGGPGGGGGGGPLVWRALGLGVKVLGVGATIGLGAVLAANGMFLAPAKLTTSLVGYKGSLMAKPLVAKSAAWIGSQSFAATVTRVGLYAGGCWMIGNVAQLTIGELAASVVINSTVCFPSPAVFHILAQSRSTSTYCLGEC